MMVHVVRFPSTLTAMLANGFVMPLRLAITIA
jgi:hypothetical protein